MRTSLKNDIATGEWKPNDIGFFDPSTKDAAAFVVIDKAMHYTDVYAFIDRMRDLSSLKSEEVVRAQIHSCLKGDALSWYTYGLSDAEKRLLQLESLADGWFRSLIGNFKPDRSETLSELDHAFYRWPQIRAGRTIREHGYGMVRFQVA